MNNKKLPICFFLTGLPGSGKSTWINNNIDTLLKDYRIISSDKFIEKYAEQVNSTYNDVFNDYIKQATSLMNSELADCIANKYNFVWDQTNTGKKSRKSKLSRLKDYNVYAVVFEVPDNILEEQLTKRTNETGKYIPKHIIDNMRDTYERPELEEGFADVIMINRG